MSLTTQSRRGGAALGVGALIVALLAAAPAAHAAGPYDDRFVLSQGHADLFYVAQGADGDPELIIHSDEFGNHSPEEFVVHAKPSVATRTAGAAIAAFLEIEPGSEYYQLPQTNRPGELFLGFGYNTADYPSLTVTHTLSNVEGPGALGLWQNSDDGPVQWIHTGRGDLDFTSVANHEHLAWGLTAQGVYTFDVTSTVARAGQPDFVTATKTYTIVVAEELPGDEPGGDVTVQITGAGAHYHTGEVASLTAGVDPADAAASYRWSTRTDAAAAWEAVDGVDGATYGFVVTRDLQVRVEALDVAGEVLATSEPVDVHIDDHGNTPVVGPELSVSLGETEGALVISVAPEGQHAELSDLELSPAADRYVSEGAVTGITVTDTRSGDLGWVADGRVRELVTGEGATLDGRYLGWTPVVESASAGLTATPGAAVAPGLDEGNGIKGWSRLGSAAEGASRGTARLGAQLRIETPVTTAAGDYTGVLLLTVI